MLKVAIEDYCFVIWTLLLQLFLSPLCFDYRIWFDYMSITHDKNHINSYQMSRNVENQELNYPTYHITIILRLETL